MRKIIMPEWISVGILSERTGVSISALHFYERKGLIKSQRNASNHR
ncbi:MerR family DNA-binding transcriptional regulator [Prodigiosinella confusarubida]